MPSSVLMTPNYVFGINGVYRHSKELLWLLCFGKSLLKEILTEILTETLTVHPIRAR